MEFELTLDSVGGETDRDAPPDWAPYELSAGPAADPRRSTAGRGPAFLRPACRVLDEGLHPIALVRRMGPQTRQSASSVHPISLELFMKLYATVAAVAVLSACAAPMMMTSTVRFTPFAQQMQDQVRRATSLPEGVLN